METPSTAPAEAIATYEPPPTPGMTSLVLADNISLVTTLPDLIVGKINQEVRAIKLPQIEAQAVIRRYEDVLVDVPDIIERVMSRIVTSSDDKEGMLASHADRMLLVKVRGALDDVRVEEAATAKGKAKFIDDAARGIREALKEVEAHAQFQEDFKKRELAEKREKIYNARKEALAPYWLITDREPLDLADIKNPAFEALLADTKERYYARVAEDRRVELMRYEYAEQVDGLGYMSDTAFADFLNVARITFEQQKEAAANAARKREERIKQLSQIGMKFNGSSDWVYDELVMSDVQITAMDDLTFSDSISRWRQIIIAREEVKAENQQRTQAAEDKRVSRLHKLSQIGMVRSVSGYAFEELNISDWEIENDSDESFLAKVANIDVAIEVRRQQQTEAKNRELVARQEAERLRLAPDKEKLDAYFRSINVATADQPAVATEEAKLMLDTFFDEIATLVNGYAQKVAAMAPEPPPVAEVAVGTTDTPF